MPNDTRPYLSFSLVAIGTLSLISGATGPLWLPLLGWQLSEQDFVNWALASIMIGCGVISVGGMLLWALAEDKKSEQK